jgi:hypothetical protein
MMRQIGATSYLRCGLSAVSEPALAYNQHTIPEPFQTELLRFLAEHRRRRETLVERFVKVGLCQAV